MIGKSNTSSLDNPLAYPVPVNRQQSKSMSNMQQQSAPAQQSSTQQAAPNPGGIGKSNFSSADNPLANFAYQSYENNSTGGQAKRLPLDAYKKKPDYFGSYESVSAPQPQQPQQQQARQPSPSQDYYDMAQYYQPQPPQHINQFQPLPPIQSQHPPFTPPQQQPPQPQYQPYNNSSMNEYESTSNEYNKMRSEVDSLSQYPFGRRFNNESSSFLNNDYTSVSYPPEASMYNTNPPYAKFIDEPPMRLNKDTIVEKNPNAIDIPAYDPIKYKSGNPQGFEYDPVSSSFPFTHVYFLVS